MKNTSFQQVLEFLKENDRVYDENAPEPPFSAVLELLSMIKGLPDRKYRLNGSFSLDSYMDDRYNLFYIPDMVFFSMLLAEKKYSAFFHEVHDFIYFKILKDGERNLTDLPLK